jgi:hypothetical protein
MAKNASDEVLLDTYRVRGRFFLRPGLPAKWHSPGARAVVSFEGHILRQVQLLDDALGQRSAF